MQPFRALTSPVFSPSGACIALKAALDQGAYAAQIFDVARGVAARAPIESDAASITWTATGDSLVYRPVDANSWCAPPTGAVCRLLRSL